MSQPSVVHYFNTRKRTAIEDPASVKARKVIILEKKLSELSDEPSDIKNIVLSKKVGPVPFLKAKQNLQKYFNVNKDYCSNSSLDIQKEKINSDNNDKKEIVLNVSNTVKIKEKIKQSGRLNELRAALSRFEKGDSNLKELQEDRQSKTQKTTNKDFNEPFSKIASSNSVSLSNDYDENVSNETKKPISTTDKVNGDVKSQKEINSVNNDPSNSDISFADIKKKLTRSERLAELRKSISNFKKGDSKLKELEQNKPQKKLKNFTDIAIEVHLSPQKILSPEKNYLSPKKDTSVSRNLFSPKKETSIIKSDSSSSIELPYKYKYLLEVFRCVDTVCQLMFNRKEVITFRKLKSGVEEMLKRNLYESHLAQIKTVYPEAYSFKTEKIKCFGVKSNNEQWELVILPLVGETMSSDLLLQRRKQFHNSLLEKLKAYHREFLLSLDPPLDIPSEKIRRLHTQFDKEQVPDIYKSDLPKTPLADKIITGREVLEKARVLVGVNKRLAATLDTFVTKTEPKQNEEAIETNSILKGIPRALLEKVRQRQAAKALQSITQSKDDEKRMEMYSRLPEIIRLLRNLYVTEKKSVLLRDIVIDKLNHSFRATMTKLDMEAHLKLISSEFPDLLIFHNLRNEVYIKLQKNLDINNVLSILDKKKISTFT